MQIQLVIVTNTHNTHFSKKHTYIKTVTQKKKTYFSNRRKIEKAIKNIKNTLKKSQKAPL